MNWATAAGEVQKQIVKVETPYGVGTGFITHAAHDLRGIATAHHVIARALEEKQPITIRYRPSEAIVVGPAGQDAVLIEAKPEKTDSVLLLVKEATAIPRPQIPLLDLG